MQNRIGFVVPLAWHQYCKGINLVIGGDLYEIAATL